MMSNIGHNKPPPTVWFDVDENVPLNETLIIYIPAENYKLGKPGQSRKTSGHVRRTSNGTLLWVIDGRFGFDVGEPTKYAFMPDDPME